MDITEPTSVELARPNFMDALAAIFGQVTEEDLFGAVSDAYVQGSVDTAQSLQPYISAKAIRDRTSYVSHFLSLNSAVDLLPLFTVGQRNTMKEISESWAMYRAVLDHLRGDTRKGKVRVVVVGDGATARTGALLAYMTKWNVISIDPAFRESPTNGVRVDRLQTYKARIEDVDFMEFDEDVIILMPHSHAPADKVLDKIHSKKQRSLVVMPCCHPGTQLPTKAYPGKVIECRDEKVMSEHNLIHIYRKI